MNKYNDTALAEKNTSGRILSAILIVAIAIVIITFSIGLPIYVRPFYYAHIEPLDMPYWTDLPAETIREAYDDVLDYLTLPGGEFKAGVFPFSEEGASHFADCKKLFTLNLVAFIISSAYIVTVLLLSKKGIVSLHRYRGFDSGFWAGVGTLSAFALFGGLAALDFDRAFEVFHKIFFPGKDNWVFDYDTDPIIWVMPEEFFMNCAILILSSVVVISALLIIIGVRRKAKNKNAGA